MKIIGSLFALMFLVHGFATAEMTVKWQVRLAHACGQRKTRVALHKAMACLLVSKNDTLSPDKSGQPSPVPPTEDTEDAGTSSDSDMQAPVVKERTLPSSLADVDFDLVLTTADLDRLAFACIQNLYQRVALLETTVQELTKTQCHCKK